MKFTYAVITVSDSCYNKTAIDTSGPSLLRALKEKYPTAQGIEVSVIIPDEKDRIVSTLKELIKADVNLILTTGGTGISKRDVTPEATREVIERELPGIPQTILSESLKITKTAMLSRGVAGTANNSLIINFPGSAKAALECLGFVQPVLLHAIQLLLDIKSEVKKTHSELQQPKVTNADNNKSKVNTDGVAMRNRKSPYPMIEFHKALEIVLEQSVNHDDVEEIEIEKSMERVLAEDVTSREPFPSFRASIKDGYAVRAEDGMGERAVKDAMAAGDDLSLSVLQPNEAVRISTGASVPEGANAVVQVEDTDLVEADSKGNEVKIKINKAPTEGQDIREIGSDIAANSIVFNRGETISAAHIGVLATLGYLYVKVFRCPSIALLSTGNELCPFNAKVVPPGHIRDSNKLTLINMLRKYTINITDCGIVKDEPDLLKSALTSAFRNHDIIVSTGGVSMGEFDLMKEVLKVDFNATVHFGRVNMKPGKPTTFATCKFEGSRKLIFALPGNPVSATVTCRLFVVPAIYRFQSSRVNVNKTIKVQSLKETSDEDRWEFVRARFVNGQDTDRPIVEEMGNQISSRLNSCAGADVLIIMPPKSASKIPAKKPQSIVFGSNLIHNPAPAPALPEYFEREAYLL